MLDDIRHGIRNSGHSYAAIARATKGAVAERTVYSLFDGEANPTIGTLNALADVLVNLPDSQRRPCDGCRHIIEKDRLDFGMGDCDIVVCRITNTMRPDTGCAMRRASDAT